MVATPMSVEQIIGLGILMLLAIILSGRDHH